MDLDLRWTVVTHAGVVFSFDELVFQLEAFDHSGVGAVATRGVEPLCRFGSGFTEFLAQGRGGKAPPGRSYGDGRDGGCA